MGKHNARYARLQVDYNDLMNLANRSDLIRVEPEEAEPGWPPEKYLIKFACAGISGLEPNGFPRRSTDHRCSLYLSREYPVKEPSLLWLTEIWHPNIDHKEPRHVCTNAVQTFYSGKPLSELVVGLAEMVQYKRYHAKEEAPFPQDREVARWVREVAEPRGWISPECPFDTQPLLREQRIVHVDDNRNGARRPVIQFGSGRVVESAVKRGGGITLGRPRSHEQGT